MSAAVPLVVGAVFGKLRVLGPAPRPEGKPGSWWLCSCECGVTRAFRGRLVHAGRAQSCGCTRPASISVAKTVHGHRASQASPEYHAWNRMKERCTNPSNIGFRYYGGRGIRVCNAWLSSFEAFLADVGLRPSEQHSIDRIDVNGNYEPRNVRWATDVEQARNKRTSVRVTLNGETLPAEEWAERLGISGTLIRKRLASGWTDERALTQPVRVLDQSWRGARRTA